MKNRLLLLGSCLALLSTWALARDASTVVKFSDPSKPGTLRVVVSNGDVTVHGRDVTEVTIESDTAAAESGGTRRSDGLRVIGTSSTFNLSEANNVITLEYGQSNWASEGNFDITVPKNTNLELIMTLGGYLGVEDVDADVTIKNLNGQIELEGLGGGAIVETMNGEIEASFTRVQTDKPLSFTSMNGEISIKLPKTAAANVRFRTQNGSILTDFDEKELVTQTESSNAYTSNSRDEMREAAREAGRAASRAAREAVEIAQEVAREMQNAMRMSEDARHAAEDARAHGKTTPVPPVVPVPPIPQMPSIPAMAGGKVISGLLNGGGVAIQITTMNGDIVVQKMEVDRDGDE